jgi:hypothetical protein
MLTRLPTFDDCYIKHATNSIQIFVENNSELCEVPNINGNFKLKCHDKEQEELYSLNDLICLALFGFPLGSATLTFKDGKYDNFDIKNLDCYPIYGNYKDVDFLRRNQIRVVDLTDFKFPLHSLSSDGHFINTSSGYILHEDYLNKDKKGRVKLPLSKSTKQNRAKTKIIIIQELVADVFLKKPNGEVKLIRKNGLERDNDYKNLEWVISTVSENINSTRNFSHSFISSQANTYDHEKITNNEENSDDEFFGIDEDTKDIGEATFCDDKNVLVDNEQIPSHEPIFEEFENSDIEEDLTDCTKKDGKLWKQAKYHNHILKTYLISEDMKLYSMHKKKILTHENTYDMKCLDNGDYTYRLNVNGKRMTINLRDILGSSYLKVPDNPVCTVHRSWNKDCNIGKYSGQQNHYSNIRWLSEKDFVSVGNAKEKIKISILGDLYSFKKSQPELIDEKSKKNGIRKVKTTTNRVNGTPIQKTFHLHILTALSFCNRINKSYKYVVHKNGDTSNNHYRNLIWLNTLSGLHNDGIRYFNVPNCPEYVLSETNVPYSFKLGTLKRMKLRKDRKGYLTLQLRTKNKECLTFLYHRIVAATRNEDFDPNLFVDHIDHDIENFQHENLRSVTPKMNSQNLRPDIIRGKRVIQIRNDGTLVEIHENSMEAAKKLGGRYVGHHISRCAWRNSIHEDKNYKSEEFIWKYELKREEKYVCKEGEIFKMLFGIFQGVSLEYENYMISNKGTIVNVTTGRSKCYNLQGYPFVTLSKGGIKKLYYVHRLVGLVFVDGRTEERHHLNHIDENIYNFDATNLEWVTASENMQHSAYKWSHPVKKICRETGNILGVYDSMTDGGRSCQRNKGGDIAKVVGKMNEKRHAYGFYWEYIEEHEIENYQELTVNIRKNQKINNI